MVFVAAQGYVLAHSTLHNRATSFSTFVGAIMVATVCGPSIGGILADNLGERWTFALAAVLALSSLASIRLLPTHGPRPPHRALRHGCRAGRRWPRCWPTGAS
jgi:MFS family permease